LTSQKVTESRSTLGNQHSMRNKLSHMTAVPLLMLLCGGSLVNAIVDSDNYVHHPEAIKFIDEMTSKHQFDRQQLASLFAKAEKKQSILDAIARPAEKTKPWSEYRKIFVNEQRIEQGVEFWKKNAAALKRAETEFGVPAQIIVAILGVETRYGRNIGSYRVVDALSTLAFDYPNRAPFFRSELEHFLLLTREQKKDPLELIGSYAGAMGYGQFMPSSYREFSVDFNGDGFNDIWNNEEDAIGSVANYFKQHGWMSGQPITTMATVKDGFDRTILNEKLEPTRSLTVLESLGYLGEQSFPKDNLATAMELSGDDGMQYWLGLTNFYVITRYNNSQLYAMAVFQLSEIVKQRYQSS